MGLAHAASGVYIPVMSSRTPEMQALMEAAHEALGRFLSDAPAGEADLANVLKFCHHFTRKMGESGYVVGEDVGTEVQLSFNARSGPAHDPDLPGAVVAPRIGTA